jgi:hypothetical protein
MARLNEGDAFADENGDDVVAELVDFALVHKGGDDFATAHHPDIREIPFCAGRPRRRSDAERKNRPAPFGMTCHG